MSNQTPYEQLKEAVNKMFTAEEDYYKSSSIPTQRNKQKLAIWSGYKKKVKEIINPPKNPMVKQATLDWLAQ